MPDQLKAFLSFSVGHLPILLVSIVGLAFIAEQRHRAPEAARWAVLGFGLTLALSIVFPLGQALLWTWVADDYLSSKQYQLALGVSGIVDSVLEAVALSFLLVAVFAGRPRIGVPPPFPPV